MGKIVTFTAGVDGSERFYSSYFEFFKDLQFRDKLNEVFINYPYDFLRYITDKIFRREGI